MKSLGLILWGPLLSVPNFEPIHPVVTVLQPSLWSCVIIWTVFSRMCLYLLHCPDGKQQFFSYLLYMCLLLLTFKTNMKYSRLHLKCHFCFKNWEVHLNFSHFLQCINQHAQRHLFLVVSVSFVQSSALSLLVTCSSHLPVMSFSWKANENYRVLSRCHVLKKSHKVFCFYRQGHCNIHI